MVYIGNVCPHGRTCHGVRSGNALGVLLQTKASDSSHQNLVDGASLCGGQLVCAALQGNHTCIKTSGKHVLIIQMLCCCDYQILPAKACNRCATAEHTPVHGRRKRLL